MGEEESYRKRKKINLNAWAAILTGVAALTTAFVGAYEKLKTVNVQINHSITAENEKTTNKKYGIVSDPDGWVNLRESADINSKAMAKILNDTNLEILEKNGNWFKVYTESGLTGYVFHNRLLIVK